MSVVWKDDTGHALTTSLATILTFSASAVAGGAKVLGATAVNTGATNRIMTIELIPSGQSAASAYIIFQDVVPANSTMPVPGGPWPASASAFVQAKQDVGTDVILRVHALEET